MFLRHGCLLPEGFRLKQERFNQGWMLAGDISATGLDLILRRSGWHFMWMLNACSRTGCGKTEASAVSRATTRALRQINGRFNAAEVDSVRVTTWPGFRTARVTAHARQIQQQSSLDAIHEQPVPQLSVP
ncbi:MAG: hypothetical protein WCC27_14235 [Acidobacteriaceae bacterium]